MVFLTFFQIKLKIILSYIIFIYTFTFCEMSENKLARSIWRCLQRVVCGAGKAQNQYNGNIPIDLSDPSNLGEYANERWHKDLPYTWTELLTHMRFEVTWRKNIAEVRINFSHGHIYHSVFGWCDCPVTIRCLAKDYYTVSDRRTAGLLSVLLRNILEMILRQFKIYTTVDAPPPPQQPSAASGAAECVCLLHPDALPHIYIDMDAILAAAKEHTS